MSLLAAAQVVDSRKFGLPQRRRRLYILGSPRKHKPPVMKTSTMKTPGLRSFLSKRGRREKSPSDLFAKFVALDGGNVADDDREED